MRRAESHPVWQRKGFGTYINKDINVVQLGMSRKSPPRPTTVPPKELTRWVGSSQKDFGKMPEDIKDEFLVSIRIAERGGKADNAEPMKGFPGGKVVDIKGDHDDCTYRCVYTVQFPQAIYALHAFKKKSNQGIATPEADMNTIRLRLKSAKRDSDEREKERREREKNVNDNKSSAGTKKRPSTGRK